MEHSNNQGMIILDLSERVAVLENEWETAKGDLHDIKEKLDELLHLKSKGMGAIWFVGILLSSGLIGIVATIIGFINNRSHL